MAAKTLYQKLWDAHLVDALPGGEALIYIDLHLIHEVTSPQAFAGLRAAGRQLRRPDRTLAVADHNIPTTGQAGGVATIEDPAARAQVEALMRNRSDFAVSGWGMGERENGIVHVVGPEQGRTRPGMTVVCGDSHTATHGAFAALAFGIGTSEVEHVFATQTLRLSPSKSMAISFTGETPDGVTAKDLALAMIGRIGTAGGTGFVLEYRGPAIERLSMEGRMTLCNMSIEAGARAGLVAADETTLEYLKSTPLPPSEDEAERLSHWVSDAGAAFDAEVEIDVSALAPMVSWGTSPQDVVPVTGHVPRSGDFKEEGRQSAAVRALEYMGLEGGERVQDIAIDRVFIGSCTNSRIEDLRAAAAVAKQGNVSDTVRAMIVPGSGLVAAQAEAEGLADVFRAAGFEWREPGCSMCLGMNKDRLAPGERCASTSNRNFEGRQGRGGRTHLMSPAMAAASALKGRITDPREFS
jgi:3-isopropylmalate/(R)-2-methylmalate dehydratase large subunit